LPRRYPDSSALSDRAQIAYLRDELEAAERQVENLETALVNARKIGAAVGIVMTTGMLTYEQAFHLLSLAGQRGQEKLRDVAERVVLTGSIAAWPSLILNDQNLRPSSLQHCPVAQT
jgi:AmiR/NasT family two-component response regulator